MPIDKKYGEKYDVIEVRLRTTLSPKEKRVLDFIDENPKCLTNAIKTMLMVEDWERYEEEKTKENGIERWPHQQLCRKGLIFPNTFGTAKLWETTSLGKMYLKNSDPVNSFYGYYEAHDMANILNVEEIDNSSLITASSVFAHIFLKSQNEEELILKITKLEKYGMPERVIDLLKKMDRIRTDDNFHRVVIA